MQKALLTGLVLSVAVVTNASETRANDSLPSPVAQMSAPMQHSGLSDTGTFTLSVQFYGTPTLTSDTLAPFVELWDFNTLTKTDFTLAASGAATDAYDVTPASPLIALHEYGIRLDPASKISTRYSGFGGEFGAIGKNGELGRYVIGSQPRVWELMLKGGRTLYLSFSEPVVVDAVAAAITLTNTNTGASIPAKMQAGPVQAATEFAMDLDGTNLDAAAPHVLRVAKSVVTMEGVPLDGAFAGDGVAADFEYELSPAQVDVFVNGYAHQETLEIRCNNNMLWYNAQTSVPAVGPVQCIQVSPQNAVNLDSEETADSACSLARTRKSTNLGTWLVALACLGLRKYSKRQT